MRTESRAARLRRLGFTNPARAEQLLGGREGFEPVLEALGDSADPDQGLLIMLRLTDADPQRFSALIDNTDELAAVTRVAGLSTALGDLLIANPQWVEGLGKKPEIDADLDADLGGRTTHLDPDEWERAVAHLRSSYHRRLLQIAAWDLMLANPVDHFPEVAAMISDLVSAILQGALSLAQAATPGSDKARIAIIAMGKTGGRELNYISDVDVLYVAEPTGEDESEALEVATRVVTTVAAAVSAPAAVAPLWPLDANLRPEGKDGPLVRTVASHVTYYERWAKDWEFQALLKARPVAGDKELGAQYLHAISPFIWSASAREQFVETTRQMRTRVESTLSRDAARQIKLGAGGLRDVEFTVQLLQLVHGRVDESLRTRTTLDALAALRDNGYVARSDADRLDRYYRFLRTLEHRIQLQKMRRSQVLPTNPVQLRRIAQAMKIEGMATAEDLEAAWKEVRSEVRDLHQTIYYRPLLPEAARLSDDDISLDADAAMDRLAGIGYRDPTRAITHISALTEGVSRTAMIQRQLLPVLLSWFAEGPEPDSGLLHFRVLSETMGRTHWYMKLLRDSNMAARRLAYILSTSRYLAEEIPRLPESVRWLEGDSELQPRDMSALLNELDALISRRDSPAGKAMAGRYLRRRSMLRTGLGLALGQIDIPQAQRALTDASEVAIHAALRGATEKVLESHSMEEPPSAYLIVGLGSFGAGEMSFGSDCDLLFVHDPLIDDHALAQKIAVEIGSTVLSMLSEGLEEPAVRADADLRPEGRHGPLVRSLDSYAEYYARWVETWERQALLRARPIVGDPKLAERFVSLIDPLRYPTGMTPSEDRSIRHMKARVESERAPRGALKTRHLKLGLGGIADVEWTVHYLQLHHAADHPALRTTSTTAALEAAREAELISDADAARLYEAWSYAQRARLALALGTGRTTGPRADTLPTDAAELANLAALLSHDVSARYEVGETWLRLARRARSVVETIFFGDDG